MWKRFSHGHKNLPPCKVSPHTITTWTLKKKLRVTNMFLFTKLRCDTKNHSKNLKPPKKKSPNYNVFFHPKKRSAEVLVDIPPHKPKVCCSSCFLWMLFTKFATLTWVSNPKLSRCHYPLPRFFLAPQNIWRT